MPKLLSAALLLLPGLAAQAVEPLASHPLPRPSRTAPATGGGELTQRVTFSEQVSRLLQTHCQSCHREGDIAPFPLMTYQDAYERRFLIHEMISTRQMPPWHASRACSRFEDDPSLSQAEIDLVERWVLAGAPEGNPRQMPEPLTFQDSWKLGEPDAALAMAEPFRPDLSGGDVYRCFVLPTSFGEDRYVSAMEVVPGSRAMVHHVLVYVESGTASLAKDAAEPGPGYECFGGPLVTVDGGLGGWAPGNNPTRLPDGIGIPVPNGARLIMQVHYSERAGVEEPDTTTLGIHLAKGPVEKRLVTLPLVNTTFKIPAGAANHEVRATIPVVPFAAHLRAITPHMHLLGKSMQVSAKLFGGAEICLVHIPEWDFHWQRTYVFEQPVAIPPLSSVQLVATYDNSAANPENPNDPPLEVGWGEATTDEMCLAFLSFTMD